MRTLRYLNAVLTLIAVLLTLCLWTMWTTTPGGALLSPVQQAHAAPKGMPNAGQQRRETVEQLKTLNKQMSDLKSLFTSGQARVRLEAGSNNN